MPSPRTPSYLLRHGVAAVTILALVTVASTPLGAAQAATAPSVVPPPASFHASVTWAGVDVQSFSQSTAALTASFRTPTPVHFAWNTTGGPRGAPYLFNVSTARMQLLYLGVILTTQDVQETNPQAASNGSFNMDWNPGLLGWLIEGEFEMQASLLAPNGTTMWNENFYIHEEAAYGVLAVLPGVLVLIALFELYAVAVSGREALSQRARLQRASQGTSPISARSGMDHDDREENSDGPGGAA